MNYFERCGYIFDVMINVLMGGKTDETVSLRVAKKWQEETKASRFGWGCWFCRFLDICVQEDHCAKQFSAKNSPAFVYIRAGIAFAFGISAVVGITKMIYDGAKRQ